MEILYGEKGKQESRAKSQVDSRQLPSLQEKREALAGILDTSYLGHK